MTLNDLHNGDSAVITKIRGRGAFRKRITEMGFVKGRSVRVVKSAPLKDPVEYEILDSKISLRRSEASLIEVITHEEASMEVLQQTPGGIPAERILKDVARDRSRTIEVALVGNPNCGKTTLFNRVSGSHEHVGNYPGVTVDIKSAVFDYRGYHFRITDLPGTYSLTAYSFEEMAVREHILEKKPDIVVNVVDAANLERNLYLTTQLIDMDITVIMALNMFDDLRLKGDVVNTALLGELLGIPVVPTISTRGKGIYRLLNRIISVYESTEPVIRHIHINYGEEVQASVLRIQQEIRKNPSFADRYSTRYLAIKLLEKDDHAKHLLSEVPNFIELHLLVQDEVARLESLYREESDTLIAGARYGFISGAIRETCVRCKESKGLSRSEKIDRILTHKYLGFPIFIAFLWIMFHSTFTLGHYPMQWIESGVDALGQLIRSVIPPGMISDLLVDGVIGGVGGVIVFLPNILILFFFISLMEDTGYMARTAFIMDKVMHLFGLHGKSFIPLVMGFGCNVPAIMATRTLENRTDRLLTMLIIPFMSCSARLPVYLVIAGAVFPGNAGNMIFLLYMIGVLFSLIMAVLFKRILFRDREAPFVMELPGYRRPSARMITRHMWMKGEHYLKKMGGVILVGSLIIWALGYFPRENEVTREYDQLISREKTSLAILQSEKGDAGVAILSADSLAGRIRQLESEREAERQSRSYIGQIGKAIEPVFRPLGFDWKIGVSLLTGFAAKEVVVSTMGVLYQSGDTAESTVSLQEKLREQLWLSGPDKGKPVFNKLTGFSLLLFVLLYLPCVAVIAAVRRESDSWLWAGFVLFYTTFIAWFVSFVFYQAGSFLLGV
ncbi:MAG: ferrous iron transport protein B [Bacteroidota bacterium]